MGFPDGAIIKSLPANAGDTGLIPGLERSPGEGNGSPFQYSCLENPMDRGAWWDTVHGVAESDVTEWLSANIHTENTTLRFHSPVDGCTFGFLFLCFGSCE